MSLTQAVMDYYKSAEEFVAQKMTWVEEIQRWKLQLEQIQRYYKELESAVNGIDWGDLSSIWGGLDNAFGSMYNIEEELMKMDKTVQKEVAAAKENAEKLKEEQLTQEEKAYSNLLQELSKKYDVDNPELSRSEKLAKEMLLHEEMVQRYQNEANDRLEDIKNDYAYNGSASSLTAQSKKYSGYKNALKQYAEASDGVSKTIFMGAKEPQEYKETTFYLKELDDEKWIAPYVGATTDNSKYKVWEGVKISPEALKKEAENYRDNANTPEAGKYNFSALTQMGVSARAGFFYNEKKNTIERVGSKNINTATKEDLEAMTEHFRTKMAEAEARSNTARSLQQKNEQYFITARMALQTKIQMYENTLKELEIAKENLKEFTRQYEEHQDLEKVRKNIKNIDDNINDVEVKG